MLAKLSRDGFTFPDLDTLFDASWKERTLRGIEPHRDHFVVMGVGLGLWERTWALRGFEAALMDATDVVESFLWQDGIKFL